MTDSLEGAAPASPLVRNIVLFGRALRTVGIPVHATSIRALLQSAELIDVTSRSEFREAARCTLVKSREDAESFDRAFDLFWNAATWEGGLTVPDRRAHGDPNGDSLTSSEARLPNQRGAQVRQAVSDHGIDSTADDLAGEGPRLHFSSQEVLRKKDFALLSGEELTDAKRFLAQMRWNLARRRSRRYVPSSRRNKLDVARLMRKNLRHGGDPLEPAYKASVTKSRRVVLLCDISGSMERYTRLLLHFLHAVESGQSAEVFVFGTRLTRITKELQGRDADSAISSASKLVTDWAGGTRIGESLRTFNCRWARRVLGKGSVVIVISDGWDRGSPELLREEIARLQRNSHRLIWLNPLLGSAGYRPVTQGIQAALPYVDDFLPVHNLECLGMLAELLNAMPAQRPIRRQHHQLRGHFDL